MVILFLVAESHLYGVTPSLSVCFTRVIENFFVIDGMIPVIVIGEKKNSQQGRIVPRKNNVIMFEVYSTVAYHARVFRRVVFPFNIVMTARSPKV